ncbi:MAG: thioredoxin family protein [Phaeodactylibacter sp.]|uniref:thioredoxin family protein n=1 Tax=Phaeodactylibacter sp. TaxID=1940289 RepID=UPI0032F04355
MKRNLITQLFLGALFLLGSGHQLSAQGIEFYHGSWEDALLKAAQEGKIIFVDAYAEWCGPCKRMARDVFPKEEVGTFFNRNFINMKIDMEKGMGLEFRKKYPVSAFPTLFFIDAEGEIVQKAKGAQQAEGLVKLGQTALSKADNLEEYQAQYESGERDPAFLYRYVKALNNAGEPSLRVANEYFDTDPDLDAEVNLKFLFEAATEADSKLFNMMAERREAIAALMGETAVADQLRRACKATLEKALKYDSEMLLEEVIGKANDHLGEGAESFELEAQMAFYQSRGQADDYRKAAKKYAKKCIDEDPEALAALATDMSKAFKNDSKVLGEAEDVAGKAAEQTTKYQHVLVYSNILLLNGNRTAAMEAANWALQMAEGDSPLAVRAVEHYIKQIQ